MELQVAIIYLGTKNLLREVPVNKIKAFEKDFLDQLKARHPETLELIRTSKKMVPEITDVLEQLAKDIIPSYN